MQAPRLFVSIEDHDETLIARWNAAVRPDDTVWHLGDFCYRCDEDYARSVFGRLRGRRRFFLRGNHDRIGSRLPWDEVFDVARVVVPRQVRVHWRPTEAGRGTTEAFVNALIDQGCQDQIPAYQA